MRKISTVPSFDGKSFLECPEKIAIVGSSPNIIGSCKGEKIDAFERVVRFNHALTEGYEKDVGSKTTDLVVNCHVHSGRDLKQLGFEKYNHSFVDKFNYLNVIYVDSNSLNGRGIIPEKFNFYFLEKSAYDQTRLLPYKLNKLPTVGFAFVCALVNVGIKPYLFGFSSSQDEKNYTGTHYFEKRPPAGPCHDIPQERVLFSKMIEQGKAVKG